MRARAAAAAVEPGVELEAMVGRAEAIRESLEEAHWHRLEELAAPTAWERIHAEHESRLEERRRAQKKARDRLLARAITAARAAICGPSEELLDVRRLLTASHEEIERKLEGAGFGERRDALEEGLVAIEDGLTPTAKADGGWSWPTTTVLHEH